MSTVPAHPGDSPRDAAPPSRFSTATQRADRRWHRAFSLGMIAAVLIHLLILLLVRNEVLLPESPFSAAGPQAGDTRAAEGGGSGLEMVTIRPEQAPEEEAVPEPVPTPEAEIVEVEPRPDPTPDPAPPSAPSRPGTGGAGTGGLAGEAVGAGRDDGDGRGGGGTEGEGAGAGITPPVPRGMILPPADRPRSVRGMEITVWVFVNERGQVDARSVRLEPPTPDARYNDRLRRSASEWVFEPARRDGQPVSAWYPFEIIL